MLNISFLGSLKIKEDGRELTEKLSVKSLALIAILMTKEGGRCSRKELIGYLWPESGEEAAKYNLRFNLWQLRKVIAPRDSGEPFLIVTRDTCRINENYGYRCDFKEIQRADLESCSAEELEALRAMFKGEFFENKYFSELEEFEELIILQRYILENKKERLLKRLVELYEKSGENQKCMNAINDCEAIDPYDEKNAGIKVSLLLKEGRYREAMVFYRKFCSKLIYDLGTEPSESFKALGTSAEEMKKKNRKTVYVNAEALPSVDGFFMAQIAERFAEMPGFSLNSYLSSGQISDLAFISRKLGAVNENGTPLVRVVSAFSDLITGMCDQGLIVSIEFSSWDELDRVSRDVLKMIKNKSGDSVELICGNRPQDL